MDKEKEYNGKYKRNIQGMGEGLVLFEISAERKKVGQNYHLFYEDKRKPPLDIAIEPNSCKIEYVSCFIQDEMINEGKIVPNIIDTFTELPIGDYDFSEYKPNIILEESFRFWKSENDIWLLKDNLEYTTIKSYEINNENKLLFCDDNFIGILFENIRKEEMVEIQNSNCLDYKRL